MGLMASIIVAPAKIRKITGARIKKKKKIAHTAVFTLSSNRPVIQHPKFPTQRVFLKTFFSSGASLGNFLISPCIMGFMKQ